MPYAQREGTRIYYEERGTGFPVVLIMGLGATMEAWQPHVTELEQHFRCILIDNRGAGKSDKPAGEYTVAMLAEDTLAVMDALAISRAGFVGISMGSAVAQYIAIHYPERAAGLVLTSSWAKCDAYTKQLFHLFTILRKTLSPADFTRYLQLVIYSPDFYNVLRDSLEEAAELSAEGYMPYEAFVSQCQACSTHDVEESLDRIQIPVLITAGDKDIFTPLSFSQIMWEKIPNSKLEIFEKGGHVHHFEEAARYNKLVTSFLQDVAEGEAS